jgi:pilus assembly protein Flp/PilA
MLSKNIFTAMLRDKAGATAIEYGLIAAVIAVASISGMQSLGSGLSENFQATADALNRK